ncbi:MAG: hypothetical protein IKT32_02760, partial [Clostridia bacterium]|nr:hypothetical protein [Clostridia bacterium]
TEIYDYFRLLYARIGVPHCPQCGKEIRRQTVDEICDKVMAMGEGARIFICAPVVRGRKGEFKKELESYKKSGYVRVEIDGSLYDFEEEIKLDKNIKHTISVVIDRLIVKDGIQKRLSDSLENAIKLANGLVLIKNGEENTLFSTKYACPDCGISVEELEPRLFSFNNPYGACDECKGIGFKNEIDEVRILGDTNRTLNEGALCVSGWNLDSSKITQMYFRALSQRYGIDLNTPIKDLPKEHLNLLLYGNDGEKIPMSYDTRTFRGSYTASYEGVIPNLERRYKETTSDYTKSEIEKYMVQKPCSSCGGKRLKKEALAVTVGGLNIYEACELSVEKLYDFVENLKLDPTQEMISAPIIKEIKARLNFLKNVGLDYLALSRMSGTLSGGEAQRIRLATQIGSGLTGVLYILDEPSIGLHQRDNEKLLVTLNHLRDIGNTLIVVEHDEDTIRSADYIVDIGPMAGALGGEIVATGTVEEIMNQPKSITGDYLSGRRKIELPEFRKPIG